MHRRARLDPGAEAIEDDATDLPFENADEWRKLQVAVSTYAMARGETKPDKSLLVPAGVTNPSTAAMAADFISGHFAERIKSATFDRDAEAAGLNARQRELAKLAIAERPRVSPERLKQADLAFGPSMRMTEEFGRKMVPMIGPALFLTLILAIGVGSIAGGLIFGFAPMLHVFGLAVVDRAGKPASRGRLFGRAMLVWGLQLAIAVLAFVVARLMSPYPNTAFAAAALGFAAILIGVPWSIIHPNAGPHDRLSGTRVVPR